MDTATREREGQHVAMPWILRLLRYAVERGEAGYAASTVRRAVGLPERWRPKQRSAGRILAERADELTRGRRRRGPLARNLDRLVADLGLEGVGADLLRFTVLCPSVAALLEAYVCATVEDDVLDAGPSVPALAYAFGVDTPEVEEALAEDSPLLTCGLVRRSRHRSFLPFEVVPDDLSRAIYAPHPDTASLLASVFHPLPAAMLTPDDYPHLAADLGRVARILRRGLDQRVPGLDVLLHGPPGTGKTELARLLVALAGAAGVEVACEGKGGDPVAADGRLDGWAACQVVLRRTPGLVVVFDEAEDAFPHDPMRRTTNARAWTHRRLETHPLPTIWIANDLDPIDPAVLRRFDVVVEEAHPPRAVRQRMIDRRLSTSATTAEARARLAADGRWSPAHLDRAARALSLLEPTSAAEGDEAVLAFLRPHLERSAAPAPPGPPQDFDLSLPSASTDLAALSDGLARRGRGTVLLTGPPGTGKTAFARAVADRAGRPLLVRTCSDLLDPFVGGTEQKLAGAFAEAARGGAVLLVDEVDALLRDRAGAERGWEVSQVTELLVQIDRFEGILLCTTNRPEDVDPAARRRFALVVRLDPPGPEGRRRLVARAFEATGLAPPSGWEAVVDKLTGLTPGDVVAARKGFELASDGRAETLLDRIASCRPPTPKAAGFARR